MEVGIKYKISVQIFPEVHVWSCQHLLSMYIYPFLITTKDKWFSCVFVPGCIPTGVTKSPSHCKGLSRQGNRNTFLLLSSTLVLSSQFKYKVKAVMGGLIVLLNWLSDNICLTICCPNVQQDENARLTRPYFVNAPKGKRISGSLMLCVTRGFLRQLAEF